ncbi:MULTISPECIES: DUF4265 domain-containing protein [Rhodanobacteraceae]|uniref:DUF4265 domain-containing protein n=1 Tax=Rhodanobacteraceae TaxID=1775411 RepID=UPI00087EC9E1|nr:MULTISPECIES: DUF4265 domain-containing protein [Rhodanobacteraceae]SDG16290.1 protein of unknown function [Dyella sp. 333MFSha]SKB57122.1 protein of unknown function [Luteibacter sp. 22Crub2.1]
MKYRDGDYVAIHADPIWRDQSNFVFRVPLESQDGRQRWEQLWGKKITETRFSLCCIPFFVYDLALGDEVEVDGQRKILKVHPSGHLTFRLWFGDRSIGSQDKALHAIAESNVLMERSSEHLLAISVRADEAQSVANALQQLEDEGMLSYETGQT